MLRKVLWIALACAVLLVALAVSRGVKFTSEPKKANEPVAVSVEEAAQPAAETPPPSPVAAAPEPTPEDLQVQEDAAATGMTTLEPEPAPEPEAPAESPPT